MIRIQYISFFLLCKERVLPALSFRMFQAVFQNCLEGTGAGKGGLDQKAAAAVEEGIAFHLPGGLPDTLGGWKRRVHMDVPDIRHCGRVCGADIGLDRKSVV